MHTKEHIITDVESNRTFNVKVRDGSLVGLQELKREKSFPFDSKWSNVPQDTADGADWWEQWGGEAPYLS